MYKRNAISLLCISGLLFVFLLTGCDIFDNGGADWSLDDVNGEIYLRIIEQNDGQGASPYLMLETVQIYGVCNNKIWADLSHRGNRITIDINGIILPSVGLRALGPAKYSSYIKLYPGENQILINYGTIHDTVNVNLSDTSIVSSGVNNELIVLDRPLYMFRPENSFACIVYTSDSDYWVIDDFIDTLEAQINIEEFQFPPGIINPFTFQVDEELIHSTNLYFKYDSEDDFDAIENVLDSYIEQVEDNVYGVSIRILNWKSFSFERNFGTHQ